MHTAISNVTDVALLSQRQVKKLRSVVAKYKAIIYARPRHTELQYITFNDPLCCQLVKITTIARISRTALSNTTVLRYLLGKITAYTVVQAVV